ncbi:MAG: hypothetical protein COA71_01770 [SAR86 cluster bacterium]|uniref:ABC-type transport auxiliary lipoprotein component domain-containing protein n=1 Tax=SAR86 cluster bacterium TaxID=2030880 RepID=A0A2A5CJC9_9GAMM|nr:MAG: hypothetical protein COA71_01770 [SAR86 cluster bacterium]
MKKIITLGLITYTALFVTACETTNSIPYQTSTSNVMEIQQSLGEINAVVTLGTFELAVGVEERPTCRLMGPISVSPGKTLPQYVKDAFLDELFAAGVYKTNSDVVISAKIEEIKFSSISPASWDIAMRVSSNRSQGYTISVNYQFSTSFSAYSACKNVADAFGPAVQELLNRVVSHPDFSVLAVES